MTQKVLTDFDESFLIDSERSDWFWTI